MINFPLIAKPRCNDGDNDNVEVIKRIILAENPSFGMINTPERCRWPASKFRCDDLPKPISKET